MRQKLYRYEEINESGLGFCDNLRGHFGRFLPVYRVFPPSPVELESPRKQNAQYVKIEKQIRK
jgi:hypothetical protein